MSTTISRRSAMGTMLGVAASLGLAGCSLRAAPPPAAATAPAGVPAAANAAPTTASAAPTTAPVAAAAGTTPVAAAPGQTVIRFHCRSGDLARHFEAYAPKFTQQNPKAAVQMEELVATNEYWVKLSALAASKTIGDVVVDISRFFPGMAYKGLYRDVESYVNSEKFDLGQYYPAAVDNTKFDGKEYGLPETYQFQSVMIYYNKSLFDAAGVAYPNTLTATYDEIVEKAQKLTKPSDGQFGYAGASGAHHIHIRSFGGDVLDAERKKSRLGEPEAIKATQWIWDLLYKYKVHPTADQITNGSDTNMFAGGKVAMLQQTLWTGTFLIPLVGGKFQYGAALIPKGPTGVMGNHSQSDLLAPTALSKAPEIAWEVVKFMTGKDIGIQKVYLNGGGPGARPDVQSDPGLQQKMIGLKEFQAALAEGRKAFPEPKPWNVRDQEINDAWGQNMDPVWLNKVPVPDGMKKVDSEAQKVLDKPRP